MAVLRLEPSLQHYAWGDRVFIPEALHLEPTERPCAEAWFGAHPESPAMVGGRRLDELIAEGGDALLGEDVGSRFEGLPYLLKILSAARPLSIQCHPDEAQAAAGFAREEALGIRRDAPERSYRDPDHKPEMIVALTPFTALCGFRPLPEIATALGELPEITELLPEFEPTPEGLRSLVGAYFALDDAEVAVALRKLLARLEGEPTARDERHPAHWALFAHRELSTQSGAPDKGLLFVFLLELVRLEPGEALCLSAGVMHAYLQGNGVELMANSDNVLRAGLTPKHIDRSALMEVVRWDAPAPPVSRPSSKVFTREFVLTELRPPAGGGEQHVARGPETLLVLPGPDTVGVTVRTQDQDGRPTPDEDLELLGGGACFVSHGTPYELEGRGGARVYRVRVPTRDRAYGAAVLHNVAVAEGLLTRGAGPRVLATVSGSAHAQRDWQARLERARSGFGSPEVISLHEDLPVNQGFGLLLAWERLRPAFSTGEGALAAFVFGEGTRATPLTEAEGGQKPALASFARMRTPDGYRAIPLAELALRHFVPVEAHLRRSGFDGLVVKWGDEVQIPTVDLGGTNPRFREADVIRFVSMRRVTEDDARNKDWVGVDGAGRITAFIPRRPLVEMDQLAARGLMQRTPDGGLRGGINLGSIAMSRLLLDVLLDEFAPDLSDASADRGRRPDLDPQLFTALTIAAEPDAARRDAAWARAQDEAEAIARLQQVMPSLLPRLRAVLDEFEARHGRPVRMVAMDFGDQYWGDVGQHVRMREFHASLRDPGPVGDIARALAGLQGLAPDVHGNLITPDSELGPGVEVRQSVVIGAQVKEGRIDRSVLVGSVCDRLHAIEAFDLYSTATDLRLDARSGAYKVVASEPVVAQEGQRITTVFTSAGADIMRVDESTDLRDRAAHYEKPILGNRLSFAEAHAQVIVQGPGQLESVRAAARAIVASGSP